MAKKRKIDWAALCKSLRERDDLTQQQAADKLRVSLRTWAGWESGEQEPSPTAQLLLELLKEKKF